MTIGQKLAVYRRLSGMTQQQLGDYLNISPQAISKWEKDLSEPALATLRALAELYKVSVDEILDLKSGFSDINVLSATEEPSEKESAAPQTATSQTIGFCKECGITVTEENLGAKQPVVLCKSCFELREARKVAAAEAQRKKLQEEAAIEAGKERVRRQKIKSRLTWSLSVASIVAGLLAARLISGMIGNFEFSSLIVTIVLTYMVFSFVSCLFFDCVVQDVVFDWFSKSIHFPGLIFTFDLDGFIWLIGMKLLFWALGLLLGIVTGIIGVLLGLICAPFAFPFVMRRVKKGDI